MTPLRLRPASAEKRRSLMRATERNLAAHAAHLHPLVDGADVFRVGDFQVSDSGLDHDTYNIVSRADFDHGYRAETVDEISEYVRRVRRPFSWWVADDTALEEAERALVPAGFIVGETEEVMQADLHEPRQNVRAHGVDIAGAGVAVLQATEQGSGVYRRQGFTVVGQCTEFGMSACGVSS